MQFPKQQMPPQLSLLGQQVSGRPPGVVERQTSLALQLVPQPVAPPGQSWVQHWPSTWLEVGQQVSELGLLSSGRHCWPDEQSAEVLQLLPQLRFSGTRHATSTPQRSAVVAERG